MKKETKYIPLMERNYGHLKGSDIIVYDNGVEIDCIVPGCDPKKGISVVKADNPDDEVLCLNYKTWKTKQSLIPHFRKNYKGAFACLVRKIERGVIDVNLPDKVYARDKNWEPLGFGSHHCSFK